jgi:hypothetical protein
MAAAHIIEPTSMYGLRRPKREVEESARTPMRGCTKRPESGPAMNTMDTEDLESPREMRYGDAVGFVSVDSISWEESGRVRARRVA